MLVRLEQGAVNEAPPTALRAKAALRAALLGLDASDAQRGPVHVVGQRVILEGFALGALGRGLDNFGWGNWVTCVNSSFRGLGNDCKLAGPM